MGLDVASVFLAPTPRQLAALLRDQHAVADAGLDDEAGPDSGTLDALASGT